jgi:hypothetical protein
VGRVKVASIQAECKKKSSQLIRVAGLRYPNYQVPQTQAALFQAPQSQLIQRLLQGDTVYQNIQIGMLHPQFDQAS